MSRTVHQIELPHLLGSAAQKLADEDGISLDQWVSIAVAQKIGSADTVAEFFRRRAEGADPQRFLEILRSGSRARAGRRTPIV